jgi:hypothetical protein
MVGEMEAAQGIHDGEKHIFFPGNVANTQKSQT